jgi:uncharacterized membrane protein YsdA (DUF1294 family)
MEFGQQVNPNKKLRQATMEYAPSTLIQIIAEYYFIASFLAFIAIGRDKFAATTGRRRTAESKLHLLSLAGGWPGTWLACKTFRHKTQKIPFQRRLGAMIAVNFLLCAITIVTIFHFLGS